MIGLELLLDVVDAGNEVGQAAATGGSNITWEVATTIIGVVALITETFIRIYLHNSKSKKEDSTDKDKDNSLSKADLNQLKSLSQSVLNNTSKISNQDIKIDNMLTTIDDLKTLIRDVEKENFTSLTNVSDKIDVLKNILLEAKMKK